MQSLILEYNKADRIHIGNVTKFATVNLKNELKWEELKWWYYVYKLMYSL